MQITYPHIIQNSIGEQIIFHAVEQHADGDKIIVENFVAPGIGPVMHTHWFQDEVITVIDGTIGYQFPGEEQKYAGAGETVAFKRGIPHRFWNAGTDTLHCKGFIQPANNAVFFLSSLFAAQNKSGTAMPEKFDAAYLLTRYKSEFDLTDMPGFVKKIVLPAICFIGRLLGKYKNFENAPAPLSK